MSKIIRSLRICKKQFKLPKSRKKGVMALPKSCGSARIIDIIHERGRGTPLCRIQMENTNEKTLIPATEGNFVGQAICFDGDSSEIGDCLPLKKIPEGSYIFCVERIPFDGGRIAVSSGTFCTVIIHDKEKKTVTIKMPSGTKVTLMENARAIIGMAAATGRTDKPLLKAGTAFYKYKSQGIYWPKVRGVAMNPVDHPHGGGNHQHVGHPTTISKHAPKNQRAGQYAARRTGKRRGVVAVAAKIE